MNSNADELAREAKQIMSKKGASSRKGFYALVGVASTVVMALFALAGLTLYEIHSCVTPGWPCNQRSAENTAEIVVELNEGHIEIQGDIDDIERMLREIKQMQEETP